jgi:hypothetical protein
MPQNLQSITCVNVLQNFVNQMDYVFPMPSVTVIDGHVLDIDDGNE